MAKRCTPCLGVDIKFAIREYLSALNPKSNIDFMLKTIPDCKDPEGIQLCSTTAEGPDKQQGTRSKRAPSKYNLFTASCMKGGEKTMKDCASEWKRQK